MRMLERISPVLFVAGTDSAAYVASDLPLLLSAAGLLYLLWLHPVVDRYFAEIAAVLKEFGSR